MVVKMSSPGRSFGGVADYCLHDPRMPGEAHHPESAERVEWTETRNLATSEGERAGRIMAATAEASPELKRLAGEAATGRKLEKPVCHYSLSWAKDEKPNRQEMRRAAQESLKALGMERCQALIVSHRDGQPHVHVIANRVDPESGKAAGLSRSKLKLSKWAEGYEREQGKIRCPARERNNARRQARETGSGSGLAPDRAAPAAGDESAAGGAGSDPGGPGRMGRPGAGAGGLAAGRGARGLGAASEAAWQGARELEKRSKREWSALYGRHQRQREQLAKDCRGVLGRFRAWRELGGGAARDRRGDPGTTRKCWDASGRSWRSGYAGSGFRLGKAHSEAARRDREQGGRILPRGPGRVGETGAGGGAVGRALTAVYGSRYRVGLVQARRAQALGVGGAVGAGAGDRRRAGLREDEAGSGKGQPREGQPRGEG